MRVAVTPMPSGGAILTMGTGVNEVVRPRGSSTDLERPGEHLWALIATWRVDPSKFDPTAPDSGIGLLDHENLMDMVGPVCLVCEVAWTPKIGQFCPGDPSS